MPKGQCTWSDNKVHELIMVKVLQTLLLNTPWSPSKYSPWEAMHRCQHLIHPSKQFWNWFCGMAFRAAIVLLLMSSMLSKCLFSIFPLSLGTASTAASLLSYNKSKYTDTVALTLPFTYQTKISAHFPTSLIKQHK